jgi:hypothetical protein
MTVNLVTGTRLQRQFWRVYRIGDGAPVRHRWGCWIDVDIDAGGLDVRIAAPEEQPAEPACDEGGDRAADAGLDEAEAGLHEALFRRLPPTLYMGARSEAGVVSTRTWHNGRSLGLRRSRYTLATSADVLLTLTDQLSPTLTTPWRGTCAPSDIEADLPVALGPSAVLSLTAGVLELRDDLDDPPDDPADPGTSVPGTSVPGWMSVDAVPRSPYPPHDWPLELADGHVDFGGHQSAAVAWWATRSDHWMRPMRTTRASRGQYNVGATLPMARGETSVLWIESLVSLDTLGHTWHASLSLGRGDGRWWLAQPVSVEFPAHELLQAAVSRLESARPALDRDPVDGESFGWAPALLTSRTAGELGLGRRSR